jgi:hypothetical protein
MKQLLPVLDKWRFPYIYGDEWFGFFPVSKPPVIAYALYICVLLFIFLMLVFAVIAAGLAIVNATMNPTEQFLGLPGKIELYKIGPKLRISNKYGSLTRKKFRMKSVTTLK